MTEQNSRSDLNVGRDLNQRASAAASALLQHATEVAAPTFATSPSPGVFCWLRSGRPGLGDRLVLVVSLSATSALPWVVGTILALAVLGVIALGAHAGGHGWFVPLPVLLLVGAWAVVVSAGDWSSPPAWLLAAIALGSALLAPRSSCQPLPTGMLPLPQGHVPLGASGVTLSPLAPTGVARVNNESWTAESLSGPLPAGAPVHVARWRGYASWCGQRPVTSQGRTP